MNRPLLVPANTRETRRPPPNPIGFKVIPRRTTVSPTSTLQQIFVERAKNPSPDSPLGLMARHQLALKPRAPSNPGGKPIFPPHSTIFSGLSPEELQLYLDAVNLLAETEGRESAASHLFRIRPEEDFMSWVAEALETKYLQVFSRHEFLREKIAVLQELRKQIRREIEAWMEISTPEEMAQALANGKRSDQIMRENQEAFRWNKPRTYPIAWRRRRARAEFERCLGVFQFDDIEREYQIAIQDVGDGNGKPSSYEFLPGSAPRELEALYERIDAYLNEVYDAPNLLERRMTQCAGLRAKLHQLECKRRPVASA